MLKAKLASLVNICTRNAWVVIVIALFLSVVSGIYASRNFAINTNVNQLISPDLPWRQRELAFVDAFQGNHEQILAVGILAIQPLDRVLHGGREFAVGASELLQEHVAEPGIRLVDTDGEHQLLDVVVHGEALVALNGNA